MKAESDYSESSSDYEEKKRKLCEKLRSRIRREIKSSSLGEPIHLNGRHHYLTEEEEAQLVLILTSWTHMTALPTYQDIIGMVGILFFFFQ
jgi:hypothetical protein